MKKKKLSLNHEFIFNFQFFYLIIIIYKQLKSKPFEFFRSFSSFCSLNKVLAYKLENPSLLFE